MNTRETVGVLFLSPVVISTGKFQRQSQVHSQAAKSIVPVEGEKDYILSWQQGCKRRNLSL